ncbi:unnamed protein product [Calypogeia fissa]
MTAHDDHHGDENTCRIYHISSTLEQGQEKGNQSTKDREEDAACCPPGDLCPICLMGESLDQDLEKGIVLTDDAEDAPDDHHQQEEEDKQVYRICYLKDTNLLKA